MLLAVASSIISSNKSSAQQPTDWCTADPKPADAIQNDHELAVGKNQYASFFFYYTNLPKKVWCFVHDDYGRSGQCIALSEGDARTECIGVSWVKRWTQPAPLPQQIQLIFQNQHEQDWRYFSVWYK